MHVLQILCLRPKVCRYWESVVCDMFLETELSEKLNNELESAGISVSDALIAKTLAAVQAARAAEVNEVPDAEWVEASEENAEKLIELAKARKGRRIKGAAPALFRVATVMAACFVLVVGAFALRFSTMRMGKEEAAQAPMMTAQNGSARNGVTYAADADSTGSADYKCYSDSMEMVEEESAVVAMEPAEIPMDVIVPASESAPADDAAIMEECEKAENSDVLEEVKCLTEQLAQAESVRLRKNRQGDYVYEFFVQGSAGVSGFYWVYEDGAVGYVEAPPEGQTGTMNAVDGSEDSGFREAVSVWVKQNGYIFYAE